MEERRQSPRIKRRDIIQYSIENLPHKRTRSDVAQIRDLSEKGVFFTTSYPLSLDFILKIKLNLPILKKPLELKARIVACEEIKKDIIYGVRVEFIDVTLEEKAPLKDFVQLFLRQKENQIKKIPN